METKASAISANAMMFDGEFFEAAALARKFAGDGGRIATMADVVQARRLAEHDELIWQRPIITSSSEYFGLSKFGTPIIIVAHGNGPLSDLEDVFISYCVSRGGQPKNGLISQAEFLRLESGAFGPVEVVPLAAVWQRKHPFQATITPEQAMEDPLVRARLGEIGDYYIARHRAISLEWAESKYLGSRGHECMLVNRDPNRQSYLSKEPDGNVASAHLLGVSDLVQYDHGHWDDDIRHTCLVSALSCYEWGDEGWVVGYRGGHMLRPHPGPGIVRDKFASVWQRLLKSGPPPLPNSSPVRALVRIGDLLFTRHETSDSGPDGGEPEYPVSKAEYLESGTFNFPMIDGDYRNPKIDHKVIRANTPPWANAFRVASAHPVWKGDDPSHHVVTVEFHRIEVGSRMRVPPMARMKEDFDLLLSLEA